MNEEKILQFDPAAYELARARMASAPLELTRRDFEQLDIVSPGLVTAAHKAQELARQEHARRAHAPVAPDPAPQVKSGSPAAPKKPRPLTRKDLDTWITDGLVQWLKPFTEKMHALEQANQTCRCA
jgi:hypothetical protein